jgi:hypothetical protein
MGSWISFLMIAAGASATLGLLYLVIGLRRDGSAERTYFGLAALGTAFYAPGNMISYGAETIDRFVYRSAWRTSGKARDSYRIGEFSMTARSLVSTLFIFTLLSSALSAAQELEHDESTPSLRNLEIDDTFKIKSVRGPEE